MKKKIATIILSIGLALGSIFLLSGCNKQIFDFKYTYTKAYVKIGEEWVDLTISKWMDYDGEQLQLILPDGTILLVNSINCVLYSGTLPRG